MIAFSTKQNSFRLPFTFLFTGLVGFVLLQVFSFFWLPSLTTASPGSPSDLGVTHLLILGFATMTAMGAVYQLIHVVLETSLQHEWIGFLHYACFTAGMIFLVTGFWRGGVTQLILSACLLLTGILLFVCHVGTTMVRARKWNSITLHVATAMFYLFLTALFGLLMGLDFKYGFWGDFHDHVLATHIWFGFFGWFLMLIIGFSYKMIPMFYLSHGYDVRFQKRTLVCLHAGLLGMAGSLLWGGSGGVRSLCLALLECGVILYNLQLQQIIKKGFKKQPGGGIAFTIWLARGLAVLLGVAFVLSLVQPQTFSVLRVLVIFAYLYLTGWLTLTILGYLSKIVPFLWWTHKYGSRVGKEDVPAMAQMINERLVRMGLWLMLVGVLVVSCGIVWSVPFVAYAGQGLLSLSSLFYLVQIVRVLFK